MQKTKKELPFLLISLVPCIYLISIYSQLPNQVPTHWNYNGEIDDYSKKSFLFVVLLLLIGSNYLIFLVLPKIDPKQKIQQMGAKLNNLRFIMTLFMSALGLYIIHLSSTSTNNPELIYPIIGLLIACLGNYFQTLKPNYFIGIRTPWTLENGEVWKKTHQLAGKIWFIGGLLIALTFLLPKKMNTIVFISITAIITIIPIIYSYKEFKKIKASNK